MKPRNLSLTCQLMLVPSVALALCGWRARWMNSRFVLGRAGGFGEGRGPPGHVTRECHCSVCSAARCWPTGKLCYSCGNPRDSPSQFHRVAPVHTGPVTSVPAWVPWGERPCPRLPWCSQTGANLGPVLDGGLKAKKKTDKRTAKTGASAASLLTAEGGFQLSVAAQGSCGSV